MNNSGYRTKCSKESLRILEPYLNPVTGILSKVQVLERNEVPYSFGISTILEKSHGSIEVPQSAAGKGYDFDQAKISCIAEKIERNALNLRSEISIKKESYNQLKKEYSCIAPEETLGHSRSRYPYLYNKDEIQDWVCAWSLSKSKMKYISAREVYFGAGDAGKKSASYLCSTNGVAAGFSVEEALIQGALELIERDHCGLWWYHQLSMPEIRIVDNEIKGKKIEKPLRFFADNEYKVKNYWLRFDFDIYVVASIAYNENKKGLSFGFGAHFSPESALERSLSELIQLFQESSKKARMPYCLDEFSFLTLTTETISYENFIKLNDKKIESSLQAINYLKDEFHKNNMEWIVHNMTDDEFPLYVVRSIAPGMCNHFPHYEFKRMQKEIPQKFDINTIDPNSIQLRI